MHVSHSALEINLTDSHSRAIKVVDSAGKAVTTFSACISCMIGKELIQACFELKPAEARCRVSGAAKAPTPDLTDEISFFLCMSNTKRDEALSKGYCSN